MRAISDEKMREKLADIEDSMFTLVRNGEDAFAIIWLDIAKQIESSRIVYKRDFYGYLMDTMTGTNLGSEILDSLEWETDEYMEIHNKYGYGKRVGELGVVWKGLIQEEKPFRLKLLLCYLKAYTEIIQPYVNKKIKTWISTKEANMNREFLVESGKQDWKSYRADMLQTERIIETALDIFRLQDGAEE
jgi:hypothetical protein